MAVSNINVMKISEQMAVCWFPFDVIIGLVELVYLLLDCDNTGRD